ncbi:GntR family transcriptional regulator [Moorellaceae bacterium AZ2]
MNKIKYLTKGQLVYETLKEQITSGKLRPGQRCSASEIAAKLGVSRTPVNEAIKLLAEQGFVTILPNVGFEVRELNWADIQELMCIRCELERLALKWAIEKASDEEIEGLRQLSREIHRAIITKDKERYYHLNKEFHFSLYTIARAWRLRELHQKLWDYEGWYAAQLDTAADQLLSLWEDHEKLIDALVERDFSKASQMLDVHVQHCLRVLKENMQFAGYNSEEALINK